MTVNTFRFLAECSLFHVKKVFMGEISITKLLVVAALVVLLFGTKKLRTLGGDPVLPLRALRKQ